MRALRALLIDALGTLVELEPPAPRLRQLLSVRLGVEVSPAQAERAVRSEIAYYRAHLNEGRDPRSLRDLRRRCAAALRESLPADAALEDLDALRDILMASLSFRAFDDAGAALASARERGLRVVVASNWDTSLPDVLERVGLGPMIDGVVASAAVGEAKPSPLVFMAALQLAGAGPGEALHVGDGLLEDVEGARAAGIEPVLVRRDGGPGPPGVRTIASLRELAAVLCSDRGSPAPTGFGP